MQNTVFCDVVSCNLVCSTPAACYYSQDAGNLHSFCWFILGDKFAVFIMTSWQTVPYLMQSVAGLSLHCAIPHSVCCRSVTALCHTSCSLLQVCHCTVPYLIQSIADLSPQSPGFSSRPVHVRFVVEKVALCTVTGV